MSPWAQKITVSPFQAKGAAMSSQASLWLLRPIICTPSQLLSRSQALLSSSSFSLNHFLNLKNDFLRQTLHGHYKGKAAIPHRDTTASLVSIIKALIFIKTRRTNILQCQVLCGVTHCSSCWDSTERTTAPLGRHSYCPHSTSEGQEFAATYASWHKY